MSCLDILKWKSFLIIPTYHMRPVSDIRHRLVIRVVLSVQIKDAGCVIFLLKVPDLLVELLARVTSLISTWVVILIM